MAAAGAGGAWALLIARQVDDEFEKNSDRPWKYVSMRKHEEVWCMDGAHFSTEGADEILKAGLEQVLLDFVLPE